ncbi:large ribosomal subunit protein mL66-like [Diadema antillarum]|uniref:large ribosomal subunit protein mL66-like n=1 Tax=Diadema antillarum TaxID=105358 RepID=UPI003A87338B
MVSSKHISTCCVHSEKYRKVYEKKDGDTIELDASFLETDSRYSAIENPHGACPICSRNLRITYKDVLILSQFVDKDGTLLPRSLTGVCSKQQRVLQECVERALEAGLLPDHRPPKAVKEKGVAAFHRF